MVPASQGKSLNLAPRAALEELRLQPANRLDSLPSSLQCSRLQDTNCQINICYLTEMSQDMAALADGQHLELVAPLISQSVHFQRKAHVTAVKESNDKRKGRQWCMTTTQYAVRSTHRLRHCSIAGLAAGILIIDSPDDTCSKISDG